MVQDKDRDVKYTVLLSRKNPIPSSRGGEEGDDESTLLPFITKDENPERTIFTISEPPKDGFYKVFFNKNIYYIIIDVILPLSCNMYLDVSLNFLCRKIALPASRSYILSKLAILMKMNETFRPFVHTDFKGHFESNLGSKAKIV